MAKQTAIWGSRCSGKTSLSVKLADELSKTGSVILVFCDRDVPPLPALFPKHRDGEIRSLGAALSAVDISEETILESATVSSSDNIVYLGYAGGENLYSYPSFGAARADYFIEMLGRMADFVLYDCPSVFFGNALAEEALKKADWVFRLYTPDLQSFLFYSSQLPLMAGDEYMVQRHKKILNCPEGEICPPEDEALSYIKENDGVIPHCRAVKQLMCDGLLPGGKTGKAYGTAVKKLCGIIKGSEGGS